jgi:hypothetical protein
MKKMTKKLHGFWALHGYEFIPAGAKLTKIDYRPKTTFELAYVSPHPEKHYWIVLEYKFNDSHFSTKISVK